MDPSCLDDVASDSLLDRLFSKDIISSRNLRYISFADGWLYACGSQREYIEEARPPFGPIPCPPPGTGPCPSRHSGLGGSDLEHGDPDAPDPVRPPLFVLM